MRQSGRTVFGVSMLLSAVALAVPAGLAAATATAVAPATVLGPAESDIAAGAVTVSNLSAETESVVIVRSGASSKLGTARSLSTFRVGGGYNASYRVALPETVTVKSDRSEFQVSNFRV